MINSVRIWLMTCSILIVMMVWIGGITRLTNSGLSITEWKPITGVIPPITEKMWLQEKIKYENTPEYKKINYDMNLAEFKRIYLIEYFHRLLGRIVGMIFIFSFIYFLLRKKLLKSTVLSMVLVLVLGCLQGFLGWYMVKSGLIDHPHVSQYRLTAHLLMATIIFMIFWWEACTPKKFIMAPEYVISCCKAIIIMVFAQIAMGGLVAGLKAGLIYNTFPLMDGKIIPNGLFELSPIWKNIFENVTAVQFLHRMIGMSIFAVVFIFYLRYPMLLTGIMLLAVISQVFLGIFTLIYQVPLILASLHQVMAFIVLAILILCYRKLSFE